MQKRDAMEHTENPPDHERRTKRNRATRTRQGAQRRATHARGGDTRPPTRHTRGYERATHARGWRHTPGRHTPTQATRARVRESDTCSRVASRSCNRSITCARFAVAKRSTPSFTSSPIAAGTHSSAACDQLRLIAVRTRRGSPLAASDSPKTAALMAAFARVALAQ